MAGRLRPATRYKLEQFFTVTDYLPDPKDLRTGLSQAEFTKHYGSVSDERFRKEQAAVWSRVMALPAYRDTLKDKEKP